MGGGNHRRNRSDICGREGQPQFGSSRWIRSERVDLPSGVRSCPENASIRESPAQPEAFALGRGAKFVQGKRSHLHEGQPAGERFRDGDDVLSRLRKERGRFRACVRAALDNFARLEHRHRSAVKRGGRQATFSLDAGEGFDLAHGESPERAFGREWAASVLDHALFRLREEMEDTYELLRAADLESESAPSYEDLGRAFGIDSTRVRNQLYRARRRLRELVLERIRDTVSSEEEA